MSLVKKNLNEVDEIFKNEKEPTITWLYNPKVTILVSGTYIGKSNKISIYNVSMRNSSKYHYKCNSRTEAIEKVREILIKEGFKKGAIKNKKVKSGGNYNLDKINGLYAQKQPENVEKEIDSLMNFNNIKDKINKKNEIIEKISKTYGVNVYDSIGDLLDQLNFTFLTKNEKESKNEEDLFIEGVYGKQSFAGVTDYIDHRRDTKEQLIDLVKKQMPKYTKSIQIIHFINFQTGEFYNTILITGQQGGWNASFLK